MQNSTIEIRAYNNPHIAGFVNFLALVTPITSTGLVDWFVDQAYVTTNGSLQFNNGLVLDNNMNITPAGPHVVTAVYRGDSNTHPSSAVIIQTAT